MEDITAQQVNDKFSNESFESVRKKLLDLTGRNSLLNYKHPGARYVRLIDELPDQVDNVLKSGKSMSFIAVPNPTEPELIEAGYITKNPLTGECITEKEPKAEEWAKYLGLDTSYELPERSSSEKDNIMTMTYRLFMSLGT